MKKFQELLQARAEAVAKARALNGKTLDERRAFTDEEQTEYAALNAQINVYDEILAREKQLVEADRMAAANEFRRDDQLPAGERRTNLDTNGVDQVAGLPGAGGFRNFGEQLLAVRMAAVSGGRTVDQRLLAAPAGMSEAVDADGGFLVATDFTAGLLTRLYEFGQIMNRCRRIPISANANAVKFKAVKESSRVTGSRWGGIQAYWAAEADAPTSKKPTFRDVEMNLKKLIALCYTTDELLADAVALESIISQAFVEEFSFMVEDSIIRGTGAGQPLGILLSPSLVTVAKESSQAAATLMVENVVKMWARCWSRSRLDSVWFINQDIEPQLYTMTVKVKNVAGSENVGGSAVYIPGGTFAGQPYSTLFGRPVIPVEYCATLGEVGDILLLDLGEYALLQKGGIEQAVSLHVKFTTDETAFRFVLRVDGQPIWDLPLTPFKGANTLSPFVALALRA